MAADTDGPAPVYWTARQFNEPVGAWAERVARAYAAVRPEALARLDQAGTADQAASHTPSETRRR